MPELNALAKQIHDSAVAHGWWDNPPSFGEVCALIHSEVSEALEEYREGNKIRPGTPTPMVYYSGGGYVATAITECCKKPEGITIELIDVIIRTLDYLAITGVDIDALMAQKMAYNKSRPYRHGGKAL